MANYQQLYEQSQKRLEEVRIRKAKVQEQVRQLIEQLGLNDTEDLPEQIQALEDKLKTDKDVLDKDIKDLEERYKALEGELS